MWLYLLGLNSLNIPESKEFFFIDLNEMIEFP